MEPKTIRLDQEIWEQLDQEADDQGFATLTEYVRWILQNRAAIKQPTAEPVEERLAELEKRMDRIEAKHESELEE